MIKLNNFAKAILKRSERELNVKLDNMVEVDFSTEDTRTFMDSKRKFYYLNLRTGALHRAEDLDNFLHTIKEDKVA
jgi:hypothetical protein